MGARPDDGQSIAGCPWSPSTVRTALISEWADALRDRRTYTPMSTAELRHLVECLTDRLLTALHADGRDDAADRARQVGTAVTRAGILDAHALERSLVAIGRHLSRAGPTNADDEPRHVTVSSAFAAGFLQATKARVLEEQESMRTAEAAAMRRLQEQLRTSEARFRAVFAESAIGIGIADMEGNIIEVNPAFGRMLGYDEDQFQQFRVDEFFTIGAPEEHHAVYAELINGTRDHLRMEAPFPHGDGHTVWTNLTVSLLRDAEGQPRYTLAMAEDVSEQRSLREHLRHQALHDALTGLPNRAMFQQRLLDACGHPSARIGVGSIDLDNFKPINDTFGHDVGDLVLREVARRLERSMEGDHTLVARMGGDEFVLLVAPCDGMKQVERMTTSMLDAVRAPYAIGPLEVRLSASAGIVERAAADTTPADIMKAADIALYSAKQNGRGRPEVFDAQRARSQSDRLTLTATLPTALINDEFLLEYQPLVALADGRVHGVEPLVRWSHPALGRVPPDRFVAIAEESGAIVELGRRVLVEACRQAQRWRVDHDSDSLFISVNLSARQAHEPGIVNQVGDALAATGLPPGALQLELTETALLDGTGQPLDALRELSAMGVRIALDDFGTGYSNLAYLDALPVHALKLDRVFVQRHTAQRLRGDDDTVLSALIELAHALGLTVTAEGVETREQAARLHALGCDHAQGWHFAAAVPASAISRLLGAAVPLGRLDDTGSLS